jgi:hypothetical protein
VSDDHHGCANCPNGGSCISKASGKASGKTSSREVHVLSLHRSPSAGSPTYNPHTPALAPELGRAYAAQRRRPTNDGEAKLRDITLAFVARLKEDALPPERVIVAVKAAIVRYGDEHQPPSLAGEEDGHVPGGEVYERLFHWLLDAYFNPRR